MNSPGADEFDAKAGVPANRKSADYGDSKIPIVPDQTEDCLTLTV